MSCRRTDSVWSSSIGEVVFGPNKSVESSRDQSLARFDANKNLTSLTTSNILGLVHSRTLSVEFVSLLFGSIETRTVHISESRLGWNGWQWSFHSRERRRIEYWFSRPMRCRSTKLSARHLFVEARWKFGRRAKNRDDCRCVLIESSRTRSSETRNEIETSRGKTSSRARSIRVKSELKSFPRRR